MSITVLDTLYNAQVNFGMIGRVEMLDNPTFMAAMSELNKAIAAIENGKRPDEAINEERNVSEKIYSEFQSWFEEQHGKRPSKLFLIELREEIHRTQEALREKQEMYDKCKDWDNRSISALYAWNEMEKRHEEYVWSIAQK